MRRKPSSAKRRGISTTELAIVLGAVLLVVIIAIGILGTRVNQDLGTTASDVANPAQLTNRFGP